MATLHEVEGFKLSGNEKILSVITVTEDNLSWKEKVEDDGISVRISWVLKLALTDGADEGETTLTVHYAKRTDNKDYSSDLSHHSETFTGPRDACSKLQEIVQAQIQKKVPNRPKSLLVIINPVSGKGKAQSIFRKVAAPLFQLFGIRVDVKVTERAKHSDEILDQYDLSQVQGVIAVGGDGTLTEVVSALLKRTMKDAGIDANNPENSLQSPSLIVSMISGGSSNGHPLFAGLSKDPVSSVLTIAIGHSQTMDVVTVHCGRTLVQYGLLLVGYGMMANIMARIEDNRWAGPARYLALPFGILLSRSLMDVAIEMIPSDTERTDASRSEGSNEQSTDGASGAAWQEITGEFLSVDMVMINPFQQNYKKCYFTQSNLNDGNIYLWTTKNCGRLEQLKFLQKLTKLDHTAFDPDYMNTYIVKSYRVRLKNKDSTNVKDNTAIVWDGDVVRLPEPHFEVKCHQGLLKIFFRADGEEMRQADPECSPSAEAQASEK